MALTTLALLMIGALLIMTKKAPEPPLAKPAKPEAVAVAPPAPAPVPPAIAPSPPIIVPAPPAPEPQRPVAEPAPAPAPAPAPTPQVVPVPTPIPEPPATIAEPAPPVAPAPVPAPPPRVIQEARAKGDTEAMASLVAPAVAKIDEPPLAPKPAPAPKPVQQTPSVKAIQPVKPPPSAPKPVAQTRSIEKAPEPPKESAKEPAQEAPPPAALPAEPTKPARAKPPGIAWPNLFGTVEARSDNLRPFTKWTWMLDRYAKEKSLEVAPCAQLGAEKCRPQVWRKFLAEVEGKSRLEQLEKVHAYMNQRTYIEDLPNYGVPDYWATPREFLSKDGDCEDYAIAKYMSLRHLGFKDEEMRVVVLQDMNLRVAHAVLVVYHEGKALLLDNQIRKVIDAASVHHYRPFFSINENFWWLHKAAAAGAPGGSPKG